MTELIHTAIDRGATLYSSVSGGKDGQAMTATLIANGFPLAGLIHADLGRIEWQQSLPMCQMLSDKFNVPLFVVRRSDGLDMVDYWKRRMMMLQGQNKPFWSSSSARYCTSDLKRGPINKFLTSTGHDFIISCEGIRAEESTARAQKEVLTIRSNSSTYYYGMTAAEAITNFKAGKKLFLTWFPVFNFSLADVLATFDNTIDQLNQFRAEYKATNALNSLWNFHPAYVLGNDRVSCKFCVLGSNNDLAVGAANDENNVLDELIEMEEFSGYTFKNGWSLRNLKNPPAEQQLTLF